MGIFVAIILTKYGIGSCNHTASRVERGVDTSFCDRHCLLFHDFMDSNSINVAHFVKLINTDYSSITENHGACFKSPLARLFISCDSCCQTNPGRATSCSCDGEWSCIENKPQ